VPFPIYTEEGTPQHIRGVCYEQLHASTNEVKLPHNQTATVWNNMCIGEFRSSVADFLPSCAAAAKRAKVQHVQP
jgi:hypothetical protein